MPNILQYVCNKHPKYIIHIQNIQYDFKPNVLNMVTIYEISLEIYFTNPHFYYKKYLSHGRIQNVQYLQHLYCFCSKVNISSKSKYRQIDCFSAPFLYFHVVNHSIDVREHKKYRNNKITFAIEGNFRSEEIVKLPSTCNINN